MYLGKKKDRNNALKKVIARRKREKRVFSSPQYKPQWFGGILFWVDKTGNPIEEITMSKIIPKPGKKATGLHNSFSTYWRDRKRS